MKGSANVRTKKGDTWCVVFYGLLKTAIIIGLDTAWLTLAVAFLFIEDGPLISRVALSLAMLCGGVLLFYKWLYWEI